MEKFSGLTADVLGSADPRFNLEPDERWRADLSGDDAAYSGLIRTGMAEVLVLLSVFGAQAKAVPNASLYADKWSSGFWAKRMPNGGGRCIANSAFWRKRPQKNF